MIFDETDQPATRINMDDWGNLNKYRVGLQAEINYTGKKLDAATALYYFNQRFYDPEIGRFIQEDLAKEYMNPYVYVGNNPANLIDPDGMASMEGSSMPQPSYPSPVTEAWLLGAGGSGGMSSVSFGSIDIGLRRQGLPNVVVPAMSANPGGRPDLGTVGNYIRDYAGSEFSQSLFENYWQAGGDITISQSRFDNIVHSAGRVQSARPVTLANGQPGIAKVHSFYSSAEYAKAFGSATIYYNQGGSPVGFSDTYNFDWRGLLGQGSRDFVAEMQTRAVSGAGAFYGAQPFNIRYGIGVRP